MFACSNKCRIHEGSTRPTRIAGLLVEQPILVAIILAGLVAGCGGSSPDMLPIPQKTAAEFSSRTNSHGLEIAVDPWVDASLVKKHFGMDLLSHQIIPFEVLFANKEAKGGFCLQPEVALLVDERGLDKVKTASQDLVIPGQEPHDATPLVLSALFGPLLLTTPILIVGLIEEEARYDAQDVARHVELLRFADRPLYPSDSNYGFLYVKLNSMRDLSRAAAVKFRVKNVRSLEEKTVIVVLRRK